MQTSSIQGFRLSPQQEHFWHALGEAHSPGLVVQAVLELAECDVDRLQGALEAAIVRHEILRTTFPRLPGMSLPVQVVGEAAQLALEWSAKRPTDGETPDQALERLAAEARRLPFDLARGPLVRAWLVAAQPGVHRLLLSLPALIADPASVAYLAAEIAAGDPAPAGQGQPPLQYADAAEILHHWIESPEEETGAAYWRRQDFSALARPLLPGGQGAGPRRPFEPRSTRRTLGPELTAKLDRLAERIEASPGLLLLAAWQATLWRSDGETDVVVAVPFDGRTCEEFLTALGPFSRMLPVRCRFDAFTTLPALVRSLAAETADVARRQDFFSAEGLYGLLTAAGELPRWPAAFDHQPASAPFAQATPTPQLPVRLLQTGIDRCDVRLSVARDNGEIALNLLYDPLQVDPGHAERLLARLLALLAGVAASPALRLAEIDVLTSEERRELLVEANRTASDVTAGRCAHQLIEEQARRSREAAALVAPDGRQLLSYGELNARANRLAHHLRALGAGPGSRIGLCLERVPEDPSLVEGLLGVLKAGAAYVPLDPSHPAERLALLAEDSAISVLLSAESLLSRLSLPSGVTVVHLDAESADRAAIAVCPADDPPLRTGPDDLAYVLYTSGSTGRPKGVMVTHRGLANYLGWARQAYGADGGNGAPVHSPIGFDLTVTSLLVPLAAGSPVCLLAEGPGIGELASALRAGRDLTLVKLTPAHLDGLRYVLSPEEAAGRTRALVIGGEALWAETLALWRENAPGTRLINEYGPTEATVGCCVYEVVAGDPTTGPVPIGRPIANIRLYLVGPGWQPVPSGVAGELWIGGDGLALGYLGRPDLTADRFVPDPFAADPGGRLYRSGDLARRRRDGQIEFLGRLDDQVKIRGFRIEPGEVEAALAAHPDVREAAVVAIDTAEGKRLAAYYVAAAALSGAALRSFLVGRLPEHLVPATFTPLEALPLTANGKVDRKALPEPLGADEGAAYAAPRTLFEELLAEIWAGALEVDRVGIDDPFFSLGGDSIRAIKALSLAQKRGATMTLQDVFQFPTIRGLADALQRRERAAAPEVDERPFGLVSEDDRRRLPPGLDDAYPVSQLQIGMLFHTERDPTGAIYHVQHSFRMNGLFNGEVMQRAVDRSIRRHPVLRTCFDLASYSEPLQLVHAEVAAPVTVDDLRAVPAEEQRAAVLAWLAAARHEPFDWSRPPLVRFHVHLLSSASFQFTLSLHHAVLDGWSVAVMLSELFARYLALLGGAAPQEEPPLASSFRELVRRERSLLATPEAADFWHRTLAGAEPSVLPRRGRGRTDAAGAAVLAAPPPAEVSDGLHRLARAAVVPLKSVLLAAHLRTLGMVTGRADVVGGVVTHGRPEQPDGERVLGMFLNTVPLRLRLSGGSWAELAQAAFDAERALLPFRNFPLPELQRRLGGRPPFEVVFNFLHYHVYRSVTGVTGLAAEEVTDYEEINYPFMATFFLGTSSQEVMLLFNYHPSELGPTEVAEIARRYHAVLAAMVAAPENRYDETLLLSTAEQQQILLDWNDAHTDYAAAGLLPELLAAQAARTPEHCAVVCAGARLTYRELDGAANHLARRLRELDVGPEVLVGVLCERSLAMVVALVAVLKAGGAYVPLDPAYPRDRLLYMLADSGVRVVLTQRHLAGLLPADGVELLPVDEAAATPAAPPPASGVTGGNAAYMIYTSGSTGRPKGAVNTHAGLLNRLLWMQDTYGLTGADRVLHKTPISFDVSVWELFWPLFTGARLVVARPGGHQDPAYLVRLIVEEGVTTAHFVPSMLRAFLDEEEVSLCTCLRRVVCSGEALPVDLGERFFARFADPRVELHNLYGPTEAAIDVTFQACARGDRAPRIAIGSPVANTRIHLLDDLSQPTPVGVAGELHIGGVQLARGYHRRPDLTAERFVPDPLAGRRGEAGARLYRTGDLARYRPDGAIEYLGRIDFQVKVRGVRIELGEIEATLASHPDVREAAVVAHPDEGGSRLAAYVVPRGELAAAELRSFLAERLPEHMVPAAFTFLAALPLAPNGKLDRKALPAPAAPPSTAAEFVAPRTPVEELVADLYASVLHREQVGAHDDFFALGGHSLSATRVASQLRRSLGVDLPLRTLFEKPTVAGLAAAAQSALQTGGTPAAPPIERAPRHGELPLSFAQQRLWFLDQLVPDSSVYNVPAALRIHGELDLTALAASLDEVMRRHEALRTTFPEVAGRPVQVVAPAVSLSLPTIELAGLPPATLEREVERLADEEARRRFSLAHGPLVRGALLRLGSDDHILQLSMHHIVSDGWSTGVLIRELATLYQAFAAGRPSPLPELPIQYADFALWQRSWLRGEVLAAHLAYWKERLAAPPVLVLPTDHPRPPIATFRGATCAARLPAELASDLRRLSRSRGATLYMALLATWKTLLHRYSGQTQILVGTPIANRNRAEIEGLIGFFVNTLALRTDLAGDPTAGELIDRIREVTLGAYAFQDLPFEKLVEELHPQRDTSRNPLFQVDFVLQNFPLGAIHLPGLTLAPLEVGTQSSKFDLTLFLFEDHQGLHATLEYSTDLFEPATAGRILAHFHALAQAAVAAPESRIADLALLSAAERHQLLREWTAQAAGAPERRSLPQLFKEQARRTPAALAVQYRDRGLTYAELDHLAADLARRLRSLGCGPETLVGLCLERSLELMVALLGVLEAGAAYLPLAPDLPRERLAMLLADARPAVVVTSTTALPQVALGDLPTLCLDVTVPVADRGTQEDGLDGVLSDEQLAYVLYTSGSTGHPKGVMIPHRGLANYLAWAAQTYPIEAGRGAPVHSPAGFDLTITSLLLPLITGRTATLLPEEPGLDGLVSALEEGGFSLVKLTPAHLAALASLLPAAALRSATAALVIGGEALAGQALDPWRSDGEPGVRLFNEYGPTETVVGCCVHEIPPGPPAPGPVPIGRPIAHMRLHLLDSHLQPVPIGVAGEIYIGGLNVGRGYLDRPELTAAQFVPDFDPAAAGSRLYRTGDLARHRPDGTIEFLGRNDHQVKLRGYRIELGEIEAVLGAHPAVRECVAAVREETPGDHRLVAYVVEQRSSQAQGEASASHVAHWQELYEETYGNAPPAADPAFNLVGWTSSYTGEPIPAAEMREWVEATVKRILALAPAGRPARALEIGCGSGLLVARIAPHCARYVGTDFSRAALRLLAEQVGEMPQVELMERPADDFGGLPAAAFDLVILNSVAQYFPGGEYLKRVVDGAARVLAPGGALFLGDLRALTLQCAFSTAVELERAPASLPSHELRRRIARRVAQEEELLVDPAFFAALVGPGSDWSYSRVEVKRGRFHNELTRFRYDATMLRTGAPLGDGEVPEWRDWQAEKWSVPELRRLLAAETPRALGMAGLPNARVLRDAAAAELLAGDGRATTAGELRQAAAEAADLGSAVDPEELWRVGEELGYEVELTWAEGGRDGALDAWFRRSGEQLSRRRAALRPTQPWAAYGNDPLAGRFARQLAPQLRAHVQERLPDYAVPGAFVLLPALPLTANGKVDRRALPAPEPAAAAALAGWAAPSSPVEQLLAAIWEDLLGSERVGRHDDFFDLGGHSLLATQVASRVRSTLHVELPLRTLFERPTLAGLAQAVAAAGQLAPAAPPIAPAPRDAPLPLSFAQQRLWFLHQLDPQSAAYNMPFAFRLSGHLDVARLARALETISERQATLRTTLVVRDGTPWQRIAPPAPLALPVVDLAGLPAEVAETAAGDLAAAESQRPFDLSRPPVVRLLLLRLKREEHALLFTVHHVSGDAWSLEVLAHELSELYGAPLEGREPRLPELPIQYVDFAVWQRAWLQGATLERLLSYWRRQLTGAPAVLELATDRPRPPVQTRRGRRESLLLPAVDVQTLGALGRQAGATPFMTLLAGFQALLFRYTGQQTIVVGTPIANRTRAETEGLVGFFANTLALRADLGDDPSFRRLLDRVREGALGAYAHQDLPFEKLVDELQPQRDMSHAPLFQVLFAYQGIPARSLRLPGLSLRPLGSGEGSARFDLTLSCVEQAADLVCNLDYDTDLYEAGTARLILRCFASLLKGAAAAPERALSDLPLLDEAEHRQVVAQPNDARREPAEEILLHQLFERRAALAAGAPAVVSATDTVTYGELDAVATRLARRLAALGVGPEVRVGLCLERSAMALAAMLGVLKAGGAYVPLDPEAPRERLATIARDAGLRVLLTQASLAATVAGLSERTLAVDDRDDALDGRLTPAAPSPDAVAYVIYTSGSTGAPKGVMVTHRAAARFVQTIAALMELAAGDRLLLFAPLSFDASVLQIFPVLSRGGAVVVHRNPREIASRELLAFCERLGVTVLDLPAALWRAWVEDLAASGARLPRRLRLCLTGGERVPVDRLRTWAGLADRPTDFLASYGPTEATVTATAFCTASDRPTLPAGKHLPIGRPLPGARAYVLDRRLRPLPRGVPGELYLGGAGLSRGYLGRPDATAAVFVPDPFPPADGGEVGGRLYRTGDLARHLHDGSLEFLGRADQQVKIRGFRLELAEIESALLRHPAVSEAAVALREDRPGDPRLAAYFVPQRAGELPAVGDLRAFLAASLPQYMLPAAFLPMPALPLLASGKVDRLALPAPDGGRPVLGGEYVAPRTVEEEILAGVWAQVLGLDRVGIHDNFFELGGDSIISIQIVARAAKAGLRITPRQLFERQTVAALAEVAASAAGAAGKQGPVTGPVPLLPIQRWFFEESFAQPHHFNQALALAAREPLDNSSLARAVAAVHAHHDALRLRFSRDPQGWSQAHADETEPAFTCADLSALPAERQDEARERAAAQVQGGFDLLRGPLARLVHFSGGPAVAGRLAWEIHHLVVDGVSWRVLLEDLETAYSQVSRGLPPMLPPKTTSYKTWAERLAAHARSGARAEELDHWRLVARKAVPRLPVDFPEGLAANTVGSEGAVSVELSRVETQALLQKVPALYRTQVNDALLAALARALAPWTGSGALRVDLEGHGREELFPDVDLSRTVGWFTTQFPVALEVTGAADSGAALIAIKEQLRAVPGRGLGYGLLRYLEHPQSEAFRSLEGAAPRSEISFNYLGQLNARAGEPPLFAPVGDAIGSLRDPGSHRTHLLEVSGLVAGGCLKLTLRFSARVHRRSTIERLATALAQALRELISSNDLAAEPVPSASDFPMAQLNEKTFHQLLAQLDEADSVGDSQR